MNTPVRQKVLSKMRGAARTDMPAPVGASPSAGRWEPLEVLARRFKEEAEAQGATVHRAADWGEAARILGGTASSEGIGTMAVCGEDPAVAGLDIDAWAQGARVGIVNVSVAGGRDDLRDMAFSVDAALTGADFAVAESGTVVMVSGALRPRILTVAAPVHIVLAPGAGLVPSCEDAFERVFASRGALPGQVCLITGPSSTSDIQAVQFRGMHGPAKLVVILVDAWTGGS
jgi:L-lactate utilization protein LutC